MSLSLSELDSLDDRDLKSIDFFSGTSQPEKTPALAFLLFFLLLSFHLFPLKFLQKLLIGF